MNRRGFFSAVVGAGAVAALPLAPVVALGRPPLPVPVPVVPPPAPAARVLTPFENMVDDILSDLRAYVGIQPDASAHNSGGPADRLGTTVGMFQPEPFKVSESGFLYSGRRRKFATLDRQVCRGVGLDPGHDLELQVDKKRARLIDELGGEIRHEYRAGSRGLVLGRLPDVSALGVESCRVSRHTDGYSLRGARTYMIERDEFILRVDVLYGWFDSVDVRPRSGLGRTLLMI